MELSFSLISAVIVEISETQQVSEKFTKREFVITNPQDQYQEFIKLECQQDKCSMLNGLLVGSVVDLKFNLRGRQWTNKDGIIMTFNTLVCWQMIRRPVSGNLSPQSEPEPHHHQETPLPGATQQDDDLPF